MMVSCLVNYYKIVPLSIIQLKLLPQTTLILFCDRCDFKILFIAVYEQRRKHPIKKSKCEKNSNITSQ